MSGRRTLVAGLAIAMIAGLAIAWSMLDGPRQTNTLVSDMENRRSSSKTGLDPLDAADGAAAGTNNQTSLDSSTTAPDRSEADPSGGNAEGSAGAAADGSKSDATNPGTDTPDLPGQPGSSTGTPGKVVNRSGLAEPPPVGVPSSARDPTERERAARARYSSPDSLPQAAAMPEAGKASEESPLDMAKLAEPEIWAEYWSREGYSPPAMVKTPVRGKLMNLLTNTQVPAAKVRVFTFFPATNSLGGAVLPVVMETVTDEHGFFEANLPTPERWGDNYPRYALSFEFEGRRIVDCATFENLRGGEHNEIGVFWAPEEPYELKVSATAPETGLTVAATGRVDPRRWESRRAKAIFPLFGPMPLSSSGISLIGTWDIINDPPFISLLRSGESTLTRQCVRSTIWENRFDPTADPSDIGKPFLPLVFANDGKLTLSGTVVDAEGVAIEGAVLTLGVNGEPQVVYSDSTGWFSFAGLPDKPLELVAAHEQFVPRSLQATPGKVDMKVELIYHRARATLHVLNAQTDEPVTEVWIDGIVRTDAYSAGDEFGNIADLQPRHFHSATGLYEFESDLVVTVLYIQAHGYQHAKLTNEQVSGEVQVRMAPGVKLERRPRDYDAAETPELFQTDEGEGPGLWSLDDDHWVEYSFNFGEPGAKFDLVLGVTNHTYGTLPLDNEYLFDLDVWVDGNKVGRMQIASDPNMQQLGRIALGNLSGQHTIRLMWMNDRYIPGQLDANVRYESIRFMEVP